MDHPDLTDCTDCTNQGIGYRLLQSEGALSILKDGVPLLAGIVPLLSLNNSLHVRLLPTEERRETGEDSVGQYDEFRFDYCNDETNARFVFRFRCYPECVLLYADVEVPFKNSIFDAKYYFVSAENGIGLAMEPSGKPAGIMANHMYCRWWCKPFFADAFEQVPERTNSLLWSDGTEYHHLLPVCHETFRAELSGSGAGLRLLASPHCGNIKKATVLLAALGSDRDPYRLAQTTVATALRAHHTTGRTRADRKYPEVFEYLGWCSWDAMYYELSESKVFEKFDELNRQQLPVKWAILDDGWSTNEYVPPVPAPPKDPKEPNYPKGHHLTSFQAKPAAFPQGLSHTIRRLKGENALSWVGVWHAFTAYWSGVEPNSAFAAANRDYLLATRGGKVIPHPDPAKGFGFWNAWYSRLKKQGVDFVKVDSQSSLSVFVEAELSVAAAAKGMHEAVEAAAGIHFNGTMINCMGMSPEDLWQRPGSALARNSMDFLPNHEKTFKDHAAQNMYNAFYTGNFIWGDWDMWWTEHPESTQNAVLRAVSGGPVYISDPIGRTDPAAVWPLILHDGKILRCDQPGLPTEDCLLTSPLQQPVPAKIWNRSGDSGILALFNINREGSPVRGTISPADIPAMSGRGERFAVFDAFNRRTRVLNHADKMEVELGELAVALYLVVPIVDGLAAIGLIDKYIAPATVSAVKRFADGSTLAVVKEGGTFGFAADKASAEVTVNGKRAEVAVRDGFYTVYCDSGNDIGFIRIS